MSRIYVVLEQTHKNDGYLMSYSPPFSLPPPPLQYSNGFHRQASSSNPSSSSSGSKINPAVLFIIVILAVLFFISGLLHLLVRFLIKHPSSSASQSNNRYPEFSTSDALQRQLQQLFHLHDSGLDQAFIDALPVFHYREIVGLKEPFDCAVCLCEFSEKDKLRLLPICSHAFHINCIDTWLLSNSTCPLCRGTLFAPGYPIENPVFDFDDFREEDVRLGGGNNVGSEIVSSGQKMGSEIEESVVVVEKGVLPVRLGKFRRVNVNNPESGDSNVGETSSSRNLDARRCFSMGSYEYVLGDSALRVTLRNERQRRELKPSKGQEGHSGSGANNNNTNDIGGDHDGGDLEGKKIGSVSKGESYSVSKIWLWSKKGKFSTSSTDVDLPWMGKTQGV